MNEGILEWLTIWTLKSAAIFTVAIVLLACARGVSAGVWQALLRAGFLIAILLPLGMHLLPGIDLPVTSLDPVRSNSEAVDTSTQFEASSSLFSADEEAMPRSSEAF